MRTLVIHAPDHAVKSHGAQSFDQMVGTGVGPGYAISPADIAKLTIPGSRVVLLRKDKQKGRAEGSLVRIVPTGAYTSNGRQRHDVHVEGFRRVTYESERLNRCGYAII